MRYRIFNVDGQILCRVDTAQKAGDVICNLGTALCRRFYVEDTAKDCAYPFTTWQYDGFGFVGTQHRTKQEALAAMGVAQ